MKGVKKSSILYIGLGLLIGILIGAFLLQFILSAITKQSIGEKIKELYEIANPGVSFEIINIEETSGIYKIVLKAISPLGITYREAYVTKDGKLLTEGVIFVETSIQQIQAYKDFVDCLDSKGVKIYGISNQTATLLQLNLLGRYSGKLYVSCDGVNIKRCTDANVQQVPSVVYRGSVYPGVQNIEWFEDLTGCKLQR
jgi:hypothetical protein